MSETHVEYVTITSPQGAMSVPRCWLPEPTLDQIMREQELHTAVLDALESWCAARQYGDLATQYSASEKLEEAAQRWFGWHTAQASDEDLPHVGW